jgi:glutamine cyclotransferase
MKRFSRIFPFIVLAMALLAVMFGSAQAQSSNPIYDPVQMLVPEVISVRPHDPGAYTQGLLWHDGSLYESAGRYGESTLRQVDPQTGAVLRSINIPEQYFAEGLALVDNKLIQLTWKAGIAFIYDLDTFDQIGTFSYTGEGWGLCYDGRYLYMSDGSPFIDVRDPQTFDLIFSGLVTYQGHMVENLNELECVGDYIYANVYETDYIVKIDKTNGVVVALIDASGLVPPDEKAQLQSGEVLNGIAYLPDSDTFLITGKHWPKMYEVTFVPQDQ